MTIPKQDLFTLIEKITPHNNKYRDLIEEGRKGSEVLQLMWEVGDILDNYIIKFNLKPHNLYWQIYGRSEGLKNSYITRDFLSYCLRIRKYFKDQSQVKDNFSTLQKYSLFREALPLLENPKYQLSVDESAKIIRLLNSTSDFSKIKKELKNIKGERIGLKNSRTQKLNEMKPVTQNFVEIYNSIFNLIRNNNPAVINQFIDEMTTDYLSVLAQLVSALTQENLFIPKVEIKSSLSPELKTFIKNLTKLVNANVTERNRFRRLVPPRKLFDLADMLNAFLVEKGIEKYRQRKGLERTVVDNE